MAKRIPLSFKFHGTKYNLVSRSKTGAEYRTEKQDLIVFLPYNLLDSFLERDTVSEVIFPFEGLNV